jgi:hypothetical protein
MVEAFRWLRRIAVVDDGYICWRRNVCLWARVVKVMKRSRLRVSDADAEV